MHTRSIKLLNINYYERKYKFSLFVYHKGRSRNVFKQKKFQAKLEAVQYSLQLY